MTLHYRQTVENIGCLHPTWNGGVEQDDADWRVGTNLGFRGSYFAAEEQIPGVWHGLDSGGHVTGGGGSLSRVDGGE